MSVDWSKVLESGILVVPTALVSAYIGARIKGHLDRAKPTVSITGFRTGKGGDLIVSKVKVPSELSQRLRNSRWGADLREEVNAAKLRSVANATERALSDAAVAIAYLDTKLSALPRIASASDDEKIDFLNDLTEPEHRIVDAAFVGALVRQELLLPLPTDEELAKTRKITQYVERTDERGGYSVNLRRAWYILCYRDKRDSPYLLPAAKAMVHFHVPSLIKLLEHTRNDLSRFAATGEANLRDIETLLSLSTPLIVEVRITNNGQSSILFTQWALLEVIHPNDEAQNITVDFVRSASYWRPNDPLEAAKQEELLVELTDVPIEPDTYFAVEAGQSVKMVYRSCAPLEELKRKYPKLVGLMGLEVFLCQVHLKRGDIDSAKHAWIHSRLGNFGSKSEQFPTEDKTIVLATNGKKRP